MDKHTYRKAEKIYREIRDLEDLLNSLNLNEKTSIRVSKYEPLLHDFVKSYS